MAAVSQVKKERIQTRATVSDVHADIAFLALASGLSFLDSARVANHAGGIVVMKRNTASVSCDELLASIGAQPQTTSVAS